MSSDDEDSRTVCKYGADCYQKNPAHLKKYKHPKKRQPSREPGESPTKRAKNGDAPEHEPESVAAVTNIDDAKERVDNENSQEGTDAEQKDETNLIIISKLPDDMPTRIKTLFLVDLPPDFYDFYKFCEKLPSKPVRKSLSAVGLELVGPYDVLMGNVKDCTKEQVRTIRC